jgi:ethanolamine utilization protein EutA (predicted chaperonin)
MPSLEEQFQQAMIRVYENAKKHEYFADDFKRMIDEYGGVGTAKRLLAKQEIQEDLMRLYEMDLLGQSMEVLVIQKRFKPLFTADEIAEAHRRLEQLGYFK